MKNILDEFLIRDNVISKSIEEKLPPRCRQAYVALGPTLLTISVGMVEGYSAIFIPQLLEERTWDIDTDMESWIASVATLPMPVSCLLGGYAMEVIGRKAIHMVDCIINLIGWIILYYASDVTSILVARFITGFSVSLIGPPSGAYLAETSDPNFRGVSLAMLSFAITSGIGLVHLLGALELHWRLIALISCTLPITSFVVMMFAPESPTYLVKKSKMDEATRAFHWCRGNDPYSEKELGILIERQIALPKTAYLNFSQYLKPQFVKPLLLMIVFFFTLQWSGSNALTFYAVDIMKASLGGNIDEYLSMMLMDLVRLLAAIVALYLQKKVRRRPHTIYTISGILLSIITISSTMFASRFYPVVLEKYSIILVLAFAGYMAFLSLGLNPLPWTMSGEVFPVASKGVGSGVAACLNFAFIFSVVKTTPFLFKNFGVDGTFLLFGIVTLLGLVILGLFLPETKDKPLHEIEDSFKGNK